jgi:hypothetical protein
MAAIEEKCGKNSARSRGMRTGDINSDKSLIRPDNGENTGSFPLCKQVLQGLQTVAFVLLISAPIVLKYV